MSDSPDIDSLVRKAFSVRDFFLLAAGEAEYKIAYADESRERFRQLHAELRVLGYTPRLAGTKDDAVLHVEKTTTGPKISSIIPAVLFLLTLAAIVSYGWLESIVYQSALSVSQPLVKGAEYVVLLLAILVLHEFAHRYEAKKAGSKPPVPYFLPGVPAFTFLPALGSVLLHREPLVNRDSLVEVGFAGPVVSVVLCAALYAAGTITATPISTAQLQSGLAAIPNISPVSVSPNLFQILIDSLLGLLGLGQASVGHVTISPIADAATTGFIVSALNLLPAAALDGGRVSYGVLGYRAARVTTYLSILALLLLDTPSYWIMAILVLIMAGRTTRTNILDEVSDISKPKRLLFVLAVALTVCSFPLPQNIGTIPLTSG